MNWCRCLGTDGAVIKLDYVGSYICDHVVRNNGSTKSVSNKLNNLRNYVISNGHSWLTELETRKLNEIVKQLKYVDISEGNRKRPLQIRHLRRIYSGMNVTNANDLLEAAMLYVGHDGLFRSGELTSGIQVADVFWNANRRTVFIWLDRTKTVCEGPGIWIRLDRYHPVMCGVSLLRKWYDLMNLWDKYEAYVFPKYTFHRTFDWRTPMSYNSLVVRIKTAVKKIKLPAREYAGHSLRAGGATDLFVANIPWPVIKKMGRWKSNAGLIYYRDEEHVAEQVQEGFRACL